MGRIKDEGWPSHSIRFGGHPSFLSERCRAGFICFFFAAPGHGSYVQSCGSESVLNRIRPSPKKTQPEKNKKNLIRIRPKKNLLSTYSNIITINIILILSSTSAFLVIIKVNLFFLKKKTGVMQSDLS